jgi:CrcB protein
MKEFLIVACGGAVGAMARYLVFITVGLHLGLAFPFGTLIVNILGSFLLGVLAEGMALVWTVSPQLRLFLVVGFLGAFTTFSTFSLDVATLYERGSFSLLLIYVLASLILSVVGLFSGLYLIRYLFAPAH